MINNNVHTIFRASVILAIFTSLAACESKYRYLAEYKEEKLSKSNTSIPEFKRIPEENYISVFASYTPTQENNRSQYASKFCDKSSNVVSDYFADKSELFLISLDFQQGGISRYRSAAVAFTQGTPCQKESASGFVLPTMQLPVSMGGDANGQPNFDLYIRPIYLKNVDLDEERIGNLVKGALAVAAIPFTGGASAGLLKRSEKADVYVEKNSGFIDEVLKNINSTSKQPPIIIRDFISSDSNEGFSAKRLAINVGIQDSGEDDAFDQDDKVNNIGLLEINPHLHGHRFSTLDINHFEDVNFDRLSAEEIFTISADENPLSKVPEFEKALGTSPLLKVTETKKLNDYILIGVVGNGYTYRHIPAKFDNGDNAEDLRICEGLMTSIQSQEWNSTERSAIAIAAFSKWDTFRNKKAELKDFMRFQVPQEAETQSNLRTAVLAEINGKINVAQAFLDDRSTCLSDDRARRIVWNRIGLGDDNIRTQRDKLEQIRDDLENISIPPLISRAEAMLIALFNGRSAGRLAEQSGHGSDIQSTVQIESDADFASNFNIETGSYSLANLHSAWNENIPHTMSRFGCLVTYDGEIVAAFQIRMTDRPEEEVPIRLAFISADQRSAVTRIKFDELSVLHRDIVSRLSFSSNGCSVEPGRAQVRNGFGGSLAADVRAAIS